MLLWGKSFCILFLDRHPFRNGEKSVHHRASIGFIEGEHALASSERKVAAILSTVLLAIAEEISIAGNTAQQWWCPRLRHWMSVFSNDEGHSGSWLLMPWDTYVRIHTYGTYGDQTTDSVPSALLTVDPWANDISDGPFFIYVGPINLY